ncbi:MAG: MerR family transcriptional regulator [Solirubrobacteraceae bacterium]|nr:MerR family transcriptional regulator [Solirubrobacteraceae bacterium]
MSTVTTDEGTGLSISAAAEALGVTAHTLRYYERAGLMLTPVDRAHSSHRRYREADLRWVTLLTKLRATGMPIRDIRAYAELVRFGEGNEAGRLALLEAHREAVLTQLAEVRRSLEAIDTKIAVYREKTHA